MNVTRPSLIEELRQVVEMIHINTLSARAGGVDDAALNMLGDDGLRRRFEERAAELKLTQDQRRRALETRDSTLDLVFGVELGDAERLEAERKRRSNPEF